MTKTAFRAVNVKIPIAIIEQIEAEQKRLQAAEPFMIWNFSDTVRRLLVLGLKATAADSSHARASAISSELRPAVGALADLVIADLERRPVKP